MSIEIVRRMGSTPRQRGSMSGQTCPDVLRMDNGDYVVIGKRGVLQFALVREAIDQCGAAVGPDEDVVVVPRQCMEDAARDIARNGGAGA